MQYLVITHLKEWYYYLLFVIVLAPKTMIMDNKKWPFHQHWEILIFLFYYLLKSADYRKLFSLAFDTNIHTHLSTLKHIRYLLVSGQAHLAFVPDE